MHPISEPFQFSLGDGYFFDGGLFELAVFEVDQFLQAGYF
jgi:hypothetical protein